jgi:hypothetical protein
MSIFTSRSLKWWQVSLLKICCVAFGIAAGAYWSAFFLPYLVPILIVGIVLAMYLAVVWFGK